MGLGLIFLKLFFCWFFVMSVATPRSITEKVFQRVGGHYQWSSTHKIFGNDCREEDYYDDDDGTLEMVQIGAERTKNVLILMSDTGGGHRASAEAIRDAFRIEFGDEYQVISTIFFFWVLSFILFYT